MIKDADLKNIENEDLKRKLPEAIRAAIKVLVHNFKLNETNDKFPKGSSWGYFEPYTRDLLISFLGILILDKSDYENKKDYNKMKKRFYIILKTLAQNQTKHGHIPSIIDEKNNLGASDTTPLFILAVVLFRKKTWRKFFLMKSFNKAKTWMEYQRPDDSGLVSQLETTDWRDEMWGFQGYCLFINTIKYCYLRLSKNKADQQRAEKIKKLMNYPSPHGLLANHGNFYAMCLSKLCNMSQHNMNDQSVNKWFDLLGNSLAILSGIASPGMAQNIISYVKKECESMQKNGDLALTLPPNFFPFVQPQDKQWCPNYEVHGLPGNYQNGGIWPFTCGFYIAALVAAGNMELAEKKLNALTDLVKLKREPSSLAKEKSINGIPEKDIIYGFNEWFRSQNDWFKGQNQTEDKLLKPKNEWFKARDDKNEPLIGHNWQTWSAALYLYAVKCVETGSTPFFDKMRAE